MEAQTYSNSVFADDPLWLILQFEMAATWPPRFQRTASLVQRHTLGMKKVSARADKTAVLPFRPVDREGM